MLRWMSVAIWLCLNGFLVGCGGSVFGPHIYDIDLTPTILPPEGGIVRVEVHTNGAEQVAATITRPDGSEFDVLLQPLLVFTYGQKWKREFRLPPNNDPEGDDQVYSIVIRVWGEDMWSKRTEPAGQVIVKGKKDGGSISPPKAGSSLPTNASDADGNGVG